MKKFVLILGLAVFFGQFLFAVEAANMLQVHFTDQDYTVSQTPGGVSVTIVGYQNQQIPGFPPVPVKFEKFVVSSGQLDSIRVVRTGSIQLGQLTDADLSFPITTYAGTEYYPNNYYTESIKNKLRADSKLNRFDGMVDRSWFGDKQVVTLAITPVVVDPVTGDLIGCINLSMEFAGTPDLQLESVDEPSQLINLLNQSGKNETFRSALDANNALGAKYLIVTGKSLISAFKPLLNWKKVKGLSTNIAAIEDIVSQYSGVDNAEKLRNYLIVNYNAGTRYVLLGGDETVIPIRYAYYANTDSDPGLDLSQICDLYYGDVNGNWDVDHDHVYGEPADDAPDMTAELLVGRLPMRATQAVTAYVSKLIAYERNPNNGDNAYLNRSLFISADQMRDYQTVGQHQLISASFPSWVTSDLTDLVEAPTGYADNPAFPTASTAINKLSEGYGILTLLIHGVSDGWVLKSNEYNTWPKSFIFTASGSDDTHGFLPNVQSNNKPGLVYSIGCDNGAFDMDAPPYPSSNPCVAESFLSKENGGAIGFVGYSRWGWVNTSWQLEQSFLDYLYNTNNNPVEAMNYSKAAFSFYRDICYGINYFGDPETKIWTNRPAPSTISCPNSLPSGTVSLSLMVSGNSQPVGSSLITVTKNDSIIAQVVAGANGVATVNFDMNNQDDFEIYATKQGYATPKVHLTPQIALDTDDDPTLPKSFALHQNFPNPFNPTTTISFDIEKLSTVTLNIYNVLGEKVATLVDKPLAAGNHKVEWNGSSSTGTPLSSGLYFARIVTEEHSDIIKMVLLK